MSTIVAGLFETIDDAEDAAHSLRRHGFASKDVSRFANNPPGQHDRFPMGGDENADPGARHAHAGTVAGAGVGAGAGAAVGAVVGGPPGAAVGAGLGAYVGSLMGTLGALEGKGDDEHPVRRPAGAMVAAHVDGVERQELAVGVFRAEGAVMIETAEGRWSGGRWLDFDPVAVPRVVAPDEQVPLAIPTQDAKAAALFRVEPRPGTRKWQVSGKGVALTHAGFEQRQDAVACAIALAEKRSSAAVEVYGRNGSLIWREIYTAENAPRLGRGAAR